MSQVVTALPGSVGTGILGDPACGTCWDVPSNPSISWDCWDWDSRGSSLRDLLGCSRLLTPVNSFIYQLCHCVAGLHAS